MTHGAIIGATATVPDLEMALRDYGDCLGLRLTVQSAVDAKLAQSWAAPESAGCRMAILQPQSGADFWLRLVEQPTHPDFVPTTSFGWAAFEMTVQDVFGWPERLAGSAFDIVGPPKAIATMEPAFIPMQILGTGREMLYLNEVLRDMPTLDLPCAQSPVDRAFIVILAAPDRPAAVAWYRDALRLDESDSFTIPYSMINRAFGLPADHLTTLTMVASGRMPIVEVDEYPPAARPRPVLPGLLPPGNAIVTLTVRSLDACSCDWITPPHQPGDAPYLGRWSATTRGPAGELLELVEAD